MNGAEAMAFNSEGACPSCSGTGVIRTVNEDSLVPDDSLTIDEGAVAPWQTLMWSLMKDIARDLGVRTDVPFRDLTPKEKEIVFHGPAKKHHLLYMNEKTNMAGEMDFGESSLHNAGRKKSGGSDSHDTGGPDSVGAGCTGNAAGRDASHGG